MIKILKEIKNIIEDWRYFCGRIDFGRSALDAKAIGIMNTFASRIENLGQNTYKISDKDFLWLINVLHLCRNNGTFETEKVKQYSKDFIDELLKQHK